MRPDRKKSKYDLRNYYNLFMEAALILVLLFMIAVVKVELNPSENYDYVSEQQEVVEMEDIQQTEHEETPPPPPPPSVPVEVPNDEVIEDQVLNINAELSLDDELKIPPPPSDNKEEDVETFFRPVQNMPKLKGGQEWIYDNLTYPEKAIRAGIHGLVIVQFIVDENGNVVDPKIIRGIGGGCDKAALEVMRKAKFTPGRQRERTVRVQMTQPIQFQLKN